MSAPVVGALLGVGAQIYANVVQKLPALREPWKHVIAGGVGSGMAVWLVDYEERAEKELEGRVHHSLSR